MLSLLVALGGVSLVFLVVVLVVVPPDMTMLADCIMVAQMGSRSVSTTTTTRNMKHDLWSTSSWSFNKEKTIKLMIPLGP